MLNSEIAVGIVYLIILNIGAPCNVLARDQAIMSVTGLPSKAAYAIKDKAPLLEILSGRSATDFKTLKANHTFLPNFIVTITRYTEINHTTAIVSIKPLLT